MTQSAILPKNDPRVGAELDKLIQAMVAFEQDESGDLGKATSEIITILQNPEAATAVGAFRDDLVQLLNLSQPANESAIANELVMHTPATLRTLGDMTGIPYGDRAGRFEGAEAAMELDTLEELPPHDPNVAAADAVAAEEATRNDFEDAVQALGDSAVGDLIKRLYDQIQQTNRKVTYLEQQNRQLSKRLAEPLQQIMEGSVRQIAELRTAIEDLRVDAGYLSFGALADLMTTASKNVENTIKRRHDHRVNKARTTVEFSEQKKDERSVLVTLFPADDPVSPNKFEVKNRVDGQWVDVTKEIPSFALEMVCEQLQVRGLNDGKRRWANITINLPEEASAVGEEAAQDQHDHDHDHQH